MAAEDTMQESSHAAVDDLVIDDRPVIVSSADRRPGVGADDPIRTMRSILRRWKLLVLFIAAGTGLGWLSVAMAAEAATAPIEVDHYQASHVLVLDGNVPETQTALSVRNLNSLAKRTTVGEVPELVASRVGITPSAASTQVRVVIRSESESMDIITIGQTPAVAEQLADAYAIELFDYLESEASSYAEESITSAQSRLDEADVNLTRVRVDLTTARSAGDDRRVALLEQDEQQFLSARIFANAALLDARADGIPVVPLETLKEASGSATVISANRFDELVDNASRGQNVEMLFGDEAESGTSGGAFAAVSSRLPTGALPRIGGGAGLSLLLGLLVVAALNRIDNRVRSKRQVEEILDLPVVAEIPSVNRRARRSRDLLSRTKPRSRFAEQYRGLASTVTYARRARPTRPNRVVLVTSPGPAEGKTTTVANLGAMLAETGERVLLLNCDFRRPKLHAHLDADDKPMDVVETAIPNIDLITNVVEDGDAAPTEVVAEQRKVIERARELYDLIIIDTAPLLATNDAVDLLDLVDDVVLVLRAGKTSIQAADRATEMLERRRTHVLGIALSDVDAKSSDDYYYYGGYDYGTAKPARGRSRAAKPERREDSSLDGSKPRRFLRRRSNRPESDTGSRETDESTAEPVIDLLVSHNLIAEGAEPMSAQSSTAMLEARRLQLEVDRLHLQREQMLDLEFRALERRQAEFEHQTELIRLEHERRSTARARRPLSSPRPPQT